MSPEIWYVRGPENSADSKGLERRLRDESSTRSWSIQTISPEATRSHNGRPVFLIRSQDARRLYQRIHRTPVTVIQSVEAEVLPKPNFHAPLHKSAISLAGFIRYKAHFSTISLRNYNKRLGIILDEANIWFTSSHISSIGDPRCLPLHVLNPDADYKELHTKKGRGTFSLSHGIKPFKSHKKRFDWKLDTAHHAKQTSGNLAFAGMSLPQGHHWDVNLIGKKSTGVEITNTTEVWRVASGGYVNVYPDAYFREGEHAVKVWPKTTKTITKPKKRRRNWRKT